MLGLWTGELHSPLPAEGGQAGQLHEDPVVRDAGARPGLELSSPGSQSVLNSAEIVRLSDIGLVMEQ